MNRSLIKAVSGWLRTPRFFFSKPQKQRTTSSDHRYPRVQYHQIDPNKGRTWVETIVRPQKDRRLQGQHSKANTNGKHDHGGSDSLLASLQLRTRTLKWRVYHQSAWTPAQTFPYPLQQQSYWADESVPKGQQHPQTQYFFNELDLLDTTIFSVLSTLMAYHFYSISLLVTGSWYLCTSYHM